VLPRWQAGFWLVEQFRYPIGRRAWEFPQGSWGQIGGGDQEALARRELAEETGLRAGSLIRLGHLFVAYGCATQGCDVYLATDLAAGEPDREASELDMIHRACTDREVDEMIDDGRLADTSSLAALTLYRRCQAARGAAT
jgi:8-oxo-dGTP pyrophosphatase MutT (NUDIX family)